MRAPNSGRLRWAFGSAVAAGSLATGASATTPSLFLADYSRILVDCSQVSSDLGGPLCTAVVSELQTRTKVPVVIAGNPAASDIVVNVRTCAAQCSGDGEVELAIWLSRPVGRTGEPAVRRAKTDILQLGDDGRLANARTVVARTLDAVFRTRAARHVLPPPRAQ